LNAHSKLIGIGYICTKAGQTLATEVVVQAVRDFSQLHKYRHKEVMAWGGARCDTKKEMEQLQDFFLGGAADFWLEVAGINYEGRTIWQKISQHPDRRVTGLGGCTNRIWL